MPALIRLIAVGIDGAPEDKLIASIGFKDKIEQRLTVLMHAQPLATEEVLLRTSARRDRAIGIAPLTTQSGKQ